MKKVRVKYQAARARGRKREKGELVEGRREGEDEEREEKRRKSLSKSVVPASTFIFL